MGVKLGHAKLQPFTPFSNWSLNEGVRKTCVFQRKTGHIPVMVKDTV